MDASINNYLDFPLQEPIDERRYERHATFVPAELLTERLSPQGYRPEILAARKDLAINHECVSLQSLCRKRICQGMTPEYGMDGPYCLMPKQVRPLLVDTDVESRVTSRFATDNASKALETEAVLINRSGAVTLGRTAVYLDSGKVFTSEHIFTCHVKAPNDPAFIAAYLNSWWGRRSLESGIAGSTGQLQLPQSLITDLPIPIVDPVVQAALGNKLRKAFRLRQLAADALQRSMALLQTHLPEPKMVNGARWNWVNGAEMLPARLDAKYYSKLFLQVRHELHERFGKRKVGDVVREISNGAEFRSFVEDGRPYLCVADVGDYDLNVDGAPKIPWSISVPEKALIQPSDVLVVRTGSLGQAVEILQEDCVTRPAISSHFVRLQLKDPSLASFVAAFLSCSCGRLLQWQIAYGAVQLQISQDELLDLPLPQLDESVEQEIAKGLRHWREFRRQVTTLTEESQSDVHAFLTRRLSEEQILEKGDEIAEWLRVNAK